MRKLIITFIFLALSLIILALFVGVQKVEKKPVLTPIRPHMYDNESSSLENIHITVFYFIPKDVISKMDTTWQVSTQKHIEDLVSFHTMQFEGSSKITYDFFPEAIIGKRSVSEYESVLGYDDNDSLSQIKEEVISRILTDGGDFYSSYTKFKKNTSGKDVYLIVFEGKGAAGNDAFALVSKSYLTDPVYKEYASTFLAHEFYHTLGLPDNYQTSSYVYKDNQQVSISLLTMKDIMGQVNIPLSHTYIDTETLKKMGL
jgi:hypothetical protein